VSEKSTTLVALDGGTTLAVSSAGRADRARLLLVHGFGGAKEDFADWIDPLAGTGWEVVAYDQRGHGDSVCSGGEEAFSLQIFVDDLVALADALQWDRFVLLGHSMGGMVAQLVALAAPQRLAGLVLMDTSHGPPDGLDPDQIALGQQIVREGGMAALMEVQKALGPGPLDSPAHLRLLKERPGYQEFCDRKSLATSAAMWVSIVDEMLRQPDRLTGLRQLALPALVIVGEEDSGFLRQCQDMAEAIPGARLAVITGAGHSPQFESPDQWWKAVTAFLGEVQA
jgi:pimeloyl-ACP methyl ester carboxylesterase